MTLEKLLELNSQYCEVLRNSQSTPEQREAMRLEYNKGVMLWRSANWAQSCLNSLRYFRRTKRYPVTLKDEKVMSRSKKR